MISNESKKRRKKRICICVSLLLIIGTISAPVIPAQAGVTTSLQLKQIQDLAVKNAYSYKKLKSKLYLKQASYKSTIKSIQLKKKNLSTIRYSPLLNLTFPDKAMEPEEVEFIYKPLQIQSEIAAIEHEMKDVLYGVKEEAANLFSEAYTLQEKIKFNEERLANRKDTLARNQARLVLGEASQKDIDSMTKSISTMESKLAADARKLSAAKKKLGKMINLDITTGYELKNPYQEATIDRTMLPNLIAYTLDHDHTYYQAKADSALALLSLDTNYNVMQKQYGGKISTITSFVNSVKKGYEIDGDALKLAYDKFIIDVDKPWEGSFRILFIKIPREWLKGAIDGSRFIQDDPYVLYTCILEYQDMLKEQESAKEELTGQVEESFENLVTVKNSYLQLREQTEALGKQVNAALYQNSLGEMGYEELRTLQEEYEENQIDTMDALNLYTQTLFSFDRLTCGAITRYLTGVGLERDTASGGSSYLTADEYEGLSYYFHMILEDYAFEFGVHVPENFVIETTDYELWCDEYQIGERTEIDKTIKHLAFSREEVNKVFVRFYENDEFVDDCMIEPLDYFGPLTINKGSYVETAEAVRAGTYSQELNEALGLTSIQLQVEDDTIAYYTIHDQDGKKMYSAEYIGIKDSFTYMTFALTDVSQLQIHCYDEDKNMAGLLIFDIEHQYLMKDTG